LPFNTAFFKLVDDWVAENPEIAQLLGPDATMMLAAPISARSPRRSPRRWGLP
jgi:hypothetical protein